MLIEFAIQHIHQVSLVPGSRQHVLRHHLIDRIVILGFDVVTMKELVRPSSNTNTVAGIKLLNLHTLFIDPGTVGRPHVHDENILFFANDSRVTSRSRMIGNHDLAIFITANHN